jgi:hypothetical protein
MRYSLLYDYKKLYKYYNKYKKYSNTILINLRDVLLRAGIGSADST